jgi:YjjG family noncanonical pyrimidine nucleotidase
MTKKHYAWLLFDADDTLFDFHSAEGHALTNTFQVLNLPFEADTLSRYRAINQNLWKALERQEITAASLPVRRFELLLEDLRLTYPASQMSDAYVEQLALRTDLIEGAAEVLGALQATSHFAIVTNGLKKVQRSRIARSTIQPHIQHLIISEEIGVAKPKAGFFDIAFDRIGQPAKQDVLMIGDSLSSDIHGGADYGLDTCWYNPNGHPRPSDLAITYEIRRLHDLLDLLE